MSSELLLVLSCTQRLQKRAFIVCVLFVVDVRHRSLFL